MAIKLPKLNLETFRPDYSERECMNYEQVAAFLGVSVPFLRRHMDEIPHKRIGERVLFGRRAVLDWLNDNQKKETGSDEQ